MNAKQPTIFIPSSCHISILFYSLVIIFITTATISASNGGNETDHQSLLSFKSLINDPFGALSSWNDSVHFCDWSGVTCGKRHRRVIALYLECLGLEGSFPPHIGNLSFLQALVMWNNSFQGSIPHELGRLSRLEIYNLEQNEFNSSIPANLSGCSNLHVLKLNDNNLVGSIPKEISFLTKLIFLEISDNKLTGGIPPFLGNMTSMYSFSARGNSFGGSIPDTLGRWKSLREFGCGSCNLNGTIPHSIYNLSILSVFSFPGNQLSGSLPLNIGAMLPELGLLQFWDNQLTGLLPPSLSNCSKLESLDMGGNNFSGRLLIDFARLRDIHLISIHSNKLLGRREAYDMQFIDSLQNCSKLLYLDLSYNNFQGVLPRSIGNLSDRFRFLNLGENLLHGKLPSSVGNLIGLTELDLGANQFTGKIPTTIGFLQNLHVADLNDNQFSGPIPDSIGNLSLLNTLVLSYNQLEGHIPTSLGNCHQILALSLMNNKFTGKVPKQLLQIKSLSIILDLSQNQLYGPLPTDVGHLKMLTQLDLSFNNLSGNIPSSLGGCTSLTMLSLRGNVFQGTIPHTLSSMKGLELFDIAQNRLLGQIPQFLEQLALEFLNISYNDFVGEVPTKGVFGNATRFSVLGNKRLCGGLVELHLPKCKVTGKHRTRLPFFVIVILIAFTLFAMLCFMYVLCKKKTKGQLSQPLGNEQVLKVSYNQLLKATNDFSETNLIGVGGYSSVYRGILDNANDVCVAVKVINLQNRGALKSFMRECEAWRNIRHRNLLKVITSCSSVDLQGNDFKALVYEFMPKGSLNDWLHSRAPAFRLNLLQRINILKDVASALDYLHNGCETAIVHGDIKPGNILLDNDIVAHVGDYGLTRLLGTNSSQSNSTGIRGTIGYTPPEYGLGSDMTSRGDVYSYGILLLEVMTGKKPTDDIFSEVLSLHKFAKMALPGQVTNVIDVELLTFYREDENAMESMIANANKIEECLALTVKIGVSCSMDSPALRMNMETVVYELQHILDLLQQL